MTQKTHCQISEGSGTLGSTDGESLGMPPPIWAGMIERYLHHRVSRGELSNDSQTVIRAVLRHWVTWVNKPPAEWTEDDVAGWVHDENIRPATRKSRLTKLRPFVRWLIAQKILTEDITQSLGRIRVPEGEARDLTTGEVFRLLGACPDDRAKLIVLLMVHTGLRCGDVSRIRIEDIDVHRRRLHVRAKGGRGEYTHWVPIPTEAWNALHRWLTEQKRHSGPLIANYHTGRALTAHTISRYVGQWIRDAGLKVMPRDGRSAHALRHTCAQHLVDAGADIRLVQHALGHASLRTTELYVRKEPPGLREVMEGRSYTHLRAVS